MLLFTPQPHFYTTSPRDQYLQQLAGEAARELYTHPEDHYYSRSPSFYTYEDLRQTRAREQYRRQEAARQAERNRRVLLERYRQQQLEEEQLIREQAYRAELERRKYIDAIRRAYAAQRGFNWAPEQDGEADDRDDEMDETIHTSPAPIHITPSSPKPSTAQPTVEQMNNAASAIQSAFRAHVNRRNAFASLNTIRTAFKLLTSSFEFPSKPSFDTAPDSSCYKLAYDSTNVPIHKYEDALMTLLSKLDNIESNGDVVVREERRNLAREIEAELESVDQKKEEAWEKYRVDAQLPVEQTIVDSVMETVEETETGSSISDAEMDDRSTKVGDDEVTPVDGEEFEEKKELDTVMEPVEPESFFVGESLPVSNEDDESDSESFLASILDVPDQTSSPVIENEDTEDSGFIVIASEPSTTEVALNL